jgi:hypothetical protein
VKETNVDVSRLVGVKAAVEPELVGAACVDVAIESAVKKVIVFL